MTQKKIRLQTYKIVDVCDECDVELRFTGLTLTSCPPQYPHFCPNCDRRYNLDHKSGIIVYEEVKE